MTTQILGGIIAQRIGGKLPLILSLSCMAVLMLLTPLLTTVGDFAAIFTIRFLEGMFAVCED